MAIYDVCILFGPVADKNSAYLSNSAGPFYDNRLNFKPQ